MFGIDRQLAHASEEGDNHIDGLHKGGESHRPFFSQRSHSMGAAQDRSVPTCSEALKFRKASNRAERLGASRKNLSLDVPEHYGALRSRDENTSFGVVRSSTERSEELRKGNVSKRFGVGWSSMLKDWS